LDLALALTSDSEERRIDRLAGALAADAALAIWSRMQAASGEGGERRPGAVRAIPQLAAWLARQLGALLRWPETATAGAFTPQQCEQFAELQFHSVAAAREAARSFPPDFVVVQPSYLASLVANWRAWLKAASPNQSV